MKGEAVQKKRKSSPGQQNAMTNLSEQAGDSVEKF